MKRCSICKIEQSLAEFNKKKLAKDGLQTVCRTCNRARSRRYHAEHLEEHRKAIKVRQARVKQESRKFIFDFLRTHPCVDCGIADVRVLEFDHVSGTKVKGVGSMISFGYSLPKIEEEIAKCEVRCRNCHIIVTYQRMGGSWHDILLAGIA